MDSTPRIACITITHNRVHLLQRAMKYFQDQTYTNKESIIFYTEEDVETAKFVNTHPEYRSLRLTQRNFGKELFVLHKQDETKTFFDIISGEEVYLKNKNNQYVIALKNGEVRWTVNKEEASFFQVDAEGSVYSFKTSFGMWLSENAQGEWLFIDKSSHKGNFNAVLMSDSSTKLIHAKFFSKENKLAHLGFDLEVVNEVDSPFIFIQLFTLEPISLGAKRNLAMECATAEYICIWDDDDWYDKERLAYQMTFMQFTNKIACSMSNTILFNHYTNQGYLNGSRREGWEQTLLCKKSEMTYYSNLNRAEDTPVLKELFQLNKLAVIEEPSLYIYNIHPFNTSLSEHFLSMINNYQTQILSVQENDKVIAQLKNL